MLCIPLLLWYFLIKGVENLHFRYSPSLCILHTYLYVTTDRDSKNVLHSFYRILLKHNSYKILSLAKIWIELEICIINVISQKWDPFSTISVMCSINMWVCCWVRAIKAFRWLRQEGHLFVPAWASMRCSFQNTWQNQTKQNKNPMSQKVENWLSDYPG